MRAPLVIILAGPNGAGKSTAAAHLLPDGMIFPNADEIAKEQPGYPSRAADFQASRLLISRMDDLEESREDFAVETTLASRSLAPRVARLLRSGYLFRLVFLHLPSPELSIARVAGRVRLGGHHIPEETIRRRYAAGMRNFRELFQALADLWGVYDARRPIPPRPIARGKLSEVAMIADPIAWRSMQEGGRDES